MKISRILGLPSRAKRAARSEIHAHWRDKPIEHGTVFYESFSGNGMLDNPEALFRELLSSPDFEHLSHVWALSDLHQYRSTVQEFAQHPRVRFVRYGSARYYRALATSEYLVNNATFPFDFSKRPGQVYLNTWHGTPLKKMGYDVADGALATANTLRNFVQADYLLSANPFMTEHMYKTSYKLTGVYRGTVIEEGYPRIDRQFLDDSQREQVREHLTTSGIALGNRKIILYAPTWKGATFGHPDDELDELARRVAEMEHHLDTSKYVVLLKTHQTVHRLAVHRRDLRSILVPNEIPTNQVLGVSEILISDYSSIFFDFLQTGRPIFFLTPDLENYAGDRGLYFEPDEWPGPAFTSASQVGEALRSAVENANAVPESHRDTYEAMRRTFTPHEDGRVALRIIDRVFRGKTEGIREYTNLSDDGRTAILLYLGGMRSNGITTSALNLLNNLDHTRFNVSAFFSESWTPPMLANEKKIHPAVRQFPRVGGMNGTKRVQLSRHVQFRRGHTTEHADTAEQKKLWDDEWYRCFGDSTFDYVVDFSGYGPFWAILLLHSPAAIRSIWLHNDLAEDAHREVKGRKRMLHSLTQMFSLYSQYDRLVSVSPALSEINKKSLAEYAEPEKFVSALNTVNAAGITRNSRADLRKAAYDDETDTVPSWVDTLLAHDDVTTFITVGRLSPEKNQERLIRAFSSVHTQNPATRLVIVGAGPLLDDLTALIAKLHLTDAVILTGLQRNPPAIMARADCFVLSSDYEGQPMVILEALVLNLPIVTVNFPSAANALPAGTGLVVPQSVEGLADGMRTFLEGNVPSPQFDADAYNTKAVGEFLTAIGIDSPEEQPAG